MGNYEQLKQAVADVIKTNGNQEITGAILQNALLSIISTVGSNATFAGIAVPSTNPGTPDQNIFYLASEPGIYTNFGNVEVTDKVFVIKNSNGNWVAQNSGIPNYSKLNGISLSGNCVSLRDAIYIESDGSYNLRIFFQGYNFIFTGKKNFQTSQSNLSISINEQNFFIIYTTESDKGLYFVKYSKGNTIPDDGIVLMILSNKGAIKVYYSAAKTYKINEIIYENYLPTNITNILVPKATRDNIVFNTINKTIQLGNSEGAAFLFYENSTKALNNIEVFTVTDLDFVYILFDIQQNNLIEVPFANIKNYDSDNYVLIAIIYNFEKILWSCGNYKIDGVSYSLQEVAANINNVKSDLEKINDFTLNNVQLAIRDVLNITSDGSNFKAKLGTRYYFIFNAKQKVQYQNDEVSVAQQDLKGFATIYLDLSEKPAGVNQTWNLKIVPFDSYFGTTSKNTILIALININANDILFTACNTVIWNDKTYKNIIEYNPIEDKTTNLKYGQIGDSITYLYDNKWETSYDDRNTADGRTGYKNENGYGVLFAKYIGVSYENHYPQGANGRTFCDYYDEWEEGHWTFPNGINIWTIFLGTNDWGTERHPLGTKDDYLNNTYSSGNRTTYGAIRKIVDKIRSQNDGKVTPRIIFMTPMQRGCFAYGDNASSTFMKSAIKIGENAQWEYVQNSYGFTLKDVVDAIKWVCEYESFRCVDLFNNSVVDKKYLNMSQTWEELEPNYPSNWIYQDTLYDNLHPTAGVGTKKIAGRLIDECKYDFYDLV
jgi:hypothetical protein